MVLSLLALGFFSKMGRISHGCYSFSCSPHFADAVRMDESELGVKFQGLTLSAEFGGGTQKKPVSDIIMMSPTSTSPTPTISENMQKKVSENMQKEGLQKQGLKNLSDGVRGKKQENRASFEEQKKSEEQLPICSSPQIIDSGTQRLADARRFADDENSNGFRKNDRKDQAKVDQVVEEGVIMPKQPKKNLSIQRRTMGEKIQKGDTGNLIGTFLETQKQARFRLATGTKRGEQEWKERKLLYEAVERGHPFRHVPDPSVPGVVLAMLKKMSNELLDNAEVMTIAVVWGGAGLEALEFVGEKALRNRNFIKEAVKCDVGFLPLIAKRAPEMEGFLADVRAANEPSFLEDVKGELPLMKAIRLADKDQVQRLLGRGADVNGTVLGGVHPNDSSLTLAVESNFDPEIVELLIKHPCTRVNFRKNIVIDDAPSGETAVMLGETAVMLAAGRKEAEVAKAMTEALLKRKDIDVGVEKAQSAKIKDRGGTALMFAISRHTHDVKRQQKEGRTFVKMRKDVIRALVSASVRSKRDSENDMVNATYSNYERIHSMPFFMRKETTALLLAVNAIPMFTSAVRILVDLVPPGKLNVDAKTLPGGETGLMVATYHGELEMVKVLLEAGANPSTVFNRLGENALFYAKKYKKSEILQLMKKYA